MLTRLSPTLWGPSMEQVKKHERRYNMTAKYVLNFKSLEQIVKEYFEAITA